MFAINLSHEDCFDIREYFTRTKSSKEFLNEFNELLSTVPASLQSKLVQGY